MLTDEGVQRSGDPYGIHIGQLSLLITHVFCIGDENQIPRFCTPSKCMRISIFAEHTSNQHNVQSPVLMHSALDQTES